MMSSFFQHTQKVKKIAKQIKTSQQLFDKKKIRFFHGGTNSTRDQTTQDDICFIDISQLQSIIEINTKKRYALVEPNVSMDQLVKETLRYGLLPPVVMEFPGITVGGAINGATLEASSYKYGQFNDTCLSYEIILGNGEIIEASKKMNADLFYGISGSYGSLGLVTCIKVQLISAKTHVLTRFIPSCDYTGTLQILKNEIIKKHPDFIDAIVYSPKKAVVITGNFVDKIYDQEKTLNKPSDEWFYERGKTASHKKMISEEIIPIYDFLFRYNQGAFWMGEYFFDLFHFPNNKVTKYLLKPFMNTRKLYDGLHALNISQNYFIQDFYIPIKKTLDFLQFSEEHIGIFPIWLCPIKPTSTLQKLSPHYIKDTMLIDVGIWGQSKKFMKDTIGVNETFESYVKKLKGRKMLYAHAYYEKEDFWKIYDKKWYDALRKKCHAHDVFPSVWEKTHVKNKPIKTHILKGTLQILWESLLGKHINS